MRGAAVIGGSIAAHAVAIALLVRFVPEREPVRAAKPPAQPVAVEIVQAPQTAAAPIEVAVLDEPAAETPRARASGTRAITSASSHEPGESPAAPAPAPKPRAHGAGSLRMRGLEVERTAAALAALADLTAIGRPMPAPTPRSGRLADAPGGRGVIHDAVATMEVGRDGTVHILDARDFSLGASQLVHTASSFDRLRHAIGSSLAKWYRDPYAGERAAAATVPTEEQEATAVACGTGVDCARLDDAHPQPRATWEATVPLVAGKLDVTSWLMRKTVGDPYASRKLALLDATRDERAERAAQFRAVQRSRSAELARRNLEQMWATTPDPAARRAALFELWDECDDDEAGLRARAMVVGWIRAHLPAGTADAYSPAELAALSARRTSSAPFAPYEP